MLFVISSVLFMSGCGIKGHLYIEEDQVATPQKGEQQNQLIINEKNSEDKTNA